MKPQTLITQILSLIILLFVSHSLFSQIITVKQDGTGDFTTIQEGINASIDGDTVLVYPGTYYENIAYNGKEITLASLYLTTKDKIYINNTIIDGNQNGSCVRIMSGEDESTVLCGFTIQNGNGYSVKKKGGGIYINNSNPVITDCLITNNNAIYGGGIYCKYSNIVLSNNTISYNYANGGGGGIILVIDAMIHFDSIKKNNIYLNHSGFGCDIKTNELCPMDIVLDTFTVLNPDFYFIASNDNLGFPVNNVIIDIEHAKIEPINANLFVNPNGENSNNGLTPYEPLKTIAFAYKKIKPDSINNNSIYLADGIYSPSTNCEKFAINMRSYVSLLGYDMENTIINAEETAYHIRSNNLNNSFSVENITFINGHGLGTYTDYGSVFLNFNNNITFKNVEIIDNIGFHGAFQSLHTDSILLDNVDILNNIGGGICLSNSFEPFKSCELRNCIIKGNYPGDFQGYIEGGGGLSVVSNFSPPNLFYGKIINVEIIENINQPDPLWGTGLGVGLILYGQVLVDYINGTISNNILRGESGAAVQLDDGAELNIYNSIIYGDSLYELSLGSGSGSSYPVTANVLYSNVEGGEQGVKIWQSNHTLNWLDGNINEDPLWDTASAFPYSLQQDSPCINAGTPMYKAGMEPPFIFGTDDTSYYLVTSNYNDTILLPSTDLAGKPRISGGRIDMGAYEFDTTAGINDLNLQNTDDNKIIVYPNPFYYHTFITFKLLHGGNVKVIIYDINGKKVKSLMNAKVSKGEFTMTWEGNNDQNQIVRQGTYIATIIINGKKAGGVKILKRK